MTFSQLVLSFCNQRGNCACQIKTTSSQKIALLEEEMLGDENRERKSNESSNFQALIKLQFGRTNMKFSHFVELTIINEPTDELYLEIVIFLIIQVGTFINCQ